jgi:hypothetical protein
VLFDSAAERDYAAKLVLECRTGRILSFERQVRVMLFVNNVKISTIVPDFLVIHKNGEREYVEVKGHETALWKLKYKLFKAIYPGARYKVVKV